MAELKPEHKAIADERHEMAEQISRRVSLWIAVGNAAGIAAAGNKLLDPLAVASAHLLLPACWAFAVGLIAAAVFNFALLTEHRSMANYFEATDPAIEKEAQRISDIAGNVMAVGLIVAGLAFTFGLFYPLIAVSLRYST